MVEKILFVSDGIIVVTTESFELTDNMDKNTAIPA